MEDETLMPSVSCTAAESMEQVQSDHEPTESHSQLELVAETPVSETSEEQPGAPPF